MIEIWLTKIDRDDPSTQKKLRLLYARYQNSPFTVVVYHSGRHDLYRSTLDLLAANRLPAKEHAFQ